MATRTTHLGQGNGLRSAISANFRNLASFWNFPQFFAIFLQLLLACPFSVLVGAFCLSAQLLQNNNLSWGGSWTYCEVRGHQKAHCHEEVKPVLGIILSHICWGTLGPPPPLQTSPIRVPVTGAPKGGGWSEMGLEQRPACTSQFTSTHVL